IRTPTAIPEPRSSIDVQPSELQGVQLRFWHFWSGETKATLDEMVSEFNTANEWGIRVDALYQGGVDDMNEKVHQAFNSGEMPHLVTGYAFQALDWRTVRDLFLDLQDYLTDPIWGFPPDELADFYPVFWSSDLAGSKRLGVPALRTAQVLYYNQTWARELGYDAPPTTLEGFQKQACAASRAYAQDENPDNDGAGGWIISTNYSTSLAWLYAFQAEVIATDGNSYRFDSEQVRQAFLFQRKLFEDGCAWQNPEPQFQAQFAQRKGLLATGSLADIPFVARALEQAGNRDEWAVLPFPATDGAPQVNVYGPSYYILQSTPAEQLASWLFVRWMLSPQNLARFAQATTTLPLSASALQLARAQGDAPPQWQAALDLLPYARHEPSLRSWLTVRWMLSDANRQLFQWYFTLEQLPATVRLLDDTANDIHAKMK
ncbi:MAG: extracellular solute-binding protein, partial [Anaerolineales bacterium]|nr:extracellular solute-binding protein [Anaerolineales bacterium]